MVPNASGTAQAVATMVDGTPVDPAWVCPPNGNRSRVMSTSMVTLFTPALHHHQCWTTLPSSCLRFIMWCNTPGPPWRRTRNVHPGWMRELWRLAPSHHVPPVRRNKSSSSAPSVPTRIPDRQKCHQEPVKCCGDHHQMMNRRSKPTLHEDTKSRATSSAWSEVAAACGVCPACVALPMICRFKLDFFCACPLKCSDTIFLSTTSCFLTRNDKYCQWGDALQMWLQNFQASTTHQMAGSAIFQASTHSRGAGGGGVAEADRRIGLGLRRQHPRFAAVPSMPVD